MEGSVPVNSSGAMWMGVPTMLPDIMASGLQKPRSVIFARFCLSSCPQKRAALHEPEISSEKTHSDALMPEKQHCTSHAFTSGSEPHVSSPEHFSA